METTIQLIGAIVSLLSLFGIGTLAKLFWEDKYGKKARMRAKKEEEAKQEMEANIRTIVKEEVSDIKEKIGLLHSADEREDSAIQAMLRDRLYEINRKCLSQRYTTQEERDNFQNLYEKYHSMGKNGCMDVIRDRFMQLPGEEQFIAESQQQDTNK